MAKLSSLDFLAICIAAYLNGETQADKNKFLDFAYTKLHNEFREIELLEVEKVEIALSHIKETV
ncbi:hypothetical protein [Mucilaginibacter psychrotolerans]|uniref:Uncharacterized protein n=1 Tax=Mucilaginibacter psychrotolerans TaxID=1524096 RepID=A0A4Y8SG62_9SPHI|nr:hypothetical protein [Mucilaginibacter psychrotolerans]TFF37918.1 hypothetical protein E2R66_10025 [Mucilaginibacter psychrotolerans]